MIIIMAVVMIMSVAMVMAIAMTKTMMITMMMMMVTIVMIIHNRWTAQSTSSASLHSRRLPLRPETC